MKQFLRVWVLILLMSTGLEVQAQPAPDETYLINFNNIDVKEVLRFISKISGKNFIFDEAELNFRVTIISEEETTVDNMMAALLQVLRIRDLTLIEQGNNLIIHTSGSVRRPARLSSQGFEEDAPGETELVTQVYTLTNLQPESISAVLNSLISESAQVDIVPESNHLVVTDITTNIDRITRLIQELDSSAPQLEIGQYLVRNTPAEDLAILAQQLIEPLAGDQLLQIIPDNDSNSVFVVSTPYLVEKTVSLMQTYDLTKQATRVISLDKLRIQDETLLEADLSTDEEGLLDEILRESRASPTEKLARIRERIIGGISEADREGIVGEISEIIDQQWQEQESFIKKLLSQQQTGTLLEDIRQIQNKILEYENSLKDIDSEEVRSRTKERIGLLKDQRKALQDAIAGQLQTGAPQTLSDPLLQNFRLTQSAQEFTGEDLSLSAYSALEDQIREIIARQQALSVQIRGQEDPGSQKELLRSLTELRQAQLIMEKRLTDQATQAEETRLLREQLRANQLRQQSIEDTIARLFEEKEAEEEPDKSIQLSKITEFKIYKLQNRTAASLQDALERIGDSLADAGESKKDLVDAIQSIEAIQDSNSLVISGIPVAIQRIEQLIRELDIPARQVFIEVLIIQTTINDSLSFGVDWGLQGRDDERSFGTTGFFSTGSPLPAALATIEDGALDGQGLASGSGGHLGVIGKVITKGDLNFVDMGLLVRALEEEGTSKIVLNPKIIAEDNVTAEIFVGENTRFQTSVIASTTGADITETNFEFRDIGTTLKVTPKLGDGSNVTLEIEQEVRRAVGEAEEETELASTVGPTTSRAETKTRVNIPDRHFLILSGMIQEERTNGATKLPCLGSIPFLGYAFGQHRRSTSQSNLVMFIRPTIVDSPAKIRELTREQYDLLQRKSSGIKKVEDFEYDIDTGLDFLDILEEDESPIDFGPFKG